VSASPDLVVLPGSTDQVAAVVRACARERVPVVARGAGTSFSGGPVAVEGGVVVSLERVSDVSIDAANACAVAGAGCITGRLQSAASEHGLMYAPDPASAQISTIGGNIACNAGGIGCLKYGVTADHVLGLTVVLADGSVLRLGGRVRKRASGYRLIQLFAGSEGTLGIITEAVLRLLPLPRHRATAMVGYASLDSAAQAVARLLGAGHLPAALELLDRASLDSVRALLPAGFDAPEAALLVEQDGADQDAVDAELREITASLAPDVVRIAAGAAERDALWAARRAVGRILTLRPTESFSEDLAVPISAIPEMVRRVREIARRHALRVMVFGHAGDGNLHPVFLFSEDQRARVGAAAAESFLAAIELGGTVSAEHGLGSLKRDFAVAEHGEAAVEIWRRLRAMLDPDGILNPGKVLPQGVPDAGFLARQPGW
jgi:glycolate oxidase